MLFGLIFLWTPPHFYAALVKESEYGGHVHAAERGRRTETKRQIVIYTAMSLIGLVPFVGAAGYIYFVVALAFGSLFMVNAWQLPRGPSRQPSGCSAFPSSTCFCCSGRCLLTPAAVSLTRL